MSDDAQITLLPWVRRGLANLVTGALTKNYAELPVALAVNGTTVTAPSLRLLGPGDITGMDAAAVIRTDPRDGADNFEPNYLAMVELALPDLPWLFTPEAPDGVRLRPWICLLVIADGPGVDARDPAVLQLGQPVDLRAELPDLRHIEAFAHAQVTLQSGETLSAALDGNPVAGLSRLVAPRKLEANRSYIACIVPTYRAGVNAGLGRSVDEHDLAPAWDANATNTTDSFKLPVYYRFRFRTGPGGDFKSLASQIRPPAQPLSAGKRIVDVSAPDFGAHPAPGPTLEFEGAVRAPGDESTSWRGAGSTPWPAEGQARYQEELRRALVPDPQAAERMVTPSVYGSTQSGKNLTDTDAPVWLTELNLDPRMRAAAGSGAQVVQRDQEALAASAWDQLGEIRKANQLLRQAQLARAASASMERRHLRAIAADGVYLQVTAPVHSRVRVALGGVEFTLRGHVAASCLPMRALSAAMRKLTRPRGPLARQLPTRGPPRIVDRLNSAALTAAGPLQAPRGMVALDDVRGDIQVAKMSSTNLATAPGWITTAELSPGAPTGTGVTTDRRTGTGVREGGVVSARLVDWNSDPDVPDLFKGTHAHLPATLEFPTDAAALERMVQNFRTAAGVINQYINAAPGPPSDRLPLGKSVELSPARVQLQARLDPELTIAARFKARILLSTGEDPLQPLSKAPQFPQAMYSALADLSPAWMLPGVDNVPRNTAALQQTNPKFVEAFLIGLNETMARELLWREFPVGRTATYFRNFWREAMVGSDGQLTQCEVPPIGSFDRSSHLGDHTADHTTGGNLLLLIRADLFRRYPSALVSAVKATWDDSKKKRGLNLAIRQWPLFRGTIGNDLTFFGFDVTRADARGPDNPSQDPNDPSKDNAGWFFVIEEHVTEPRFGLEPVESQPGNSWNDLRWSDVEHDLDRGFLNPAPEAPPAPREGVAWGPNAASMAHILMRRPVRVAMHGRALLTASP